MLCYFFTEHFSKMLFKFFELLAFIFFWKKTHFHFLFVLGKAERALPGLYSGSGTIMILLQLKDIVYFVFMVVHIYVIVKNWHQTPQVNSCYKIVRPK